MVRGAGLEPAQYCYRQDLNLVRLPISPPALKNKTGEYVIRPPRNRSTFDFSLYRGAYRACRETLRLQRLRPAWLQARSKHRMVDVANGDLQSLRFECHDTSMPV